MSQDVPPIAAVDRSLTILEVVADAADPLGVTSIADRVSMTKSTVYKHLSTLEQHGHVENLDGQYAPAAGLVDLGIRAQCGNGVVTAAAPQVEELAEMTSEVAGLVVERTDRVVDAYVSAAGADRSFPAFNTRHHHCSAAGKAILAAHDRARAEAIVSSSSTLPALTDNTITETDALFADLDRISDRGVAFDRREQFPRVNSVAVGFTVDESVGALYVSGWADELSGKRFEENIPGLLFSASRMIQTALRTGQSAASGQE